MLYLVIILGVAILFICITLKIENYYLKAEKKEIIKEVKQSIHSINEKQAKIIDKLLINQPYNVDLNTDIKELSKEVLALHQDFIKKYMRQ